MKHKRMKNVNRLYELLLKLPKRDMSVEELDELKTNLDLMRTKENAPLIDALTGVIDKIHVEVTGDKQLLEEYNAKIAPIITRINEQPLPARKVGALVFISAIIGGIAMPAEDQMAVLELVKMVTFFERYLSKHVALLVGVGNAKGTGRKGEGKGEGKDGRQNNQTRQ